MILKICEQYFLQFYTVTNRTVYICPDKTKNELGVLQYIDMQLSKSRNKNVDFVSYR